MIELYQLEQLTAFKWYGTLSKAADELHMSQPTLTRSMQKLESEFGVPLFRRSKNRLEFNENGLLAAEYAQRVLDQAQNMLDGVRTFDRASHTISIGSCAPMPLITTVQNAALLYPDMTISSECKDCEPLIEGLKTRLYQIIILPYKPDDKSFTFIESGSESLFFALPPAHRFADRDGLYMKEMDGENMLLYADIGFWRSLPEQMMPHSRFLVQNERFAFEELINSSILPCFVSDLSIQRDGKPADRVIIPVLDQEASVTYYTVCLRNTLPKVQKLFLI